MLSEIAPGGSVKFPAFMAQREYMIPFRQREGLPAALERWQPTVDAMLDGICTDATMYFMVDQKRLSAGEYHRRPGVHVDGNWIAAEGIHRDAPYPGHRHPDPEPSPGPRHFHAGRHNQHTHGLYAPELLLLASNVVACKAYVGAFSDIPRKDGDCSHFDLSGASGVTLAPNRVYRATATTLHETVPVPQPCERTLVRINIPGFDPSLRSQC